MSDVNPNLSAAPHKLTNRMRKGKPTMDALETVLGQVAENMRQAEAADEAEAVRLIIDELFTMVSDAEDGMGVSYGPAPRGGRRRVRRPYRRWPIRC